MCEFANLGCVLGVEWQIEVVLTGILKFIGSGAISSFRCILLLVWCFLPGLENILNSVPDVKRKQQRSDWCIVGTPVVADAAAAAIPPAFAAVAAAALPMPASHGATSTLHRPGCTWAYSRVYGIFSPSTTIQVPLLTGSIASAVTCGVRDD